MGFSPNLQYFYHSDPSKKSIVRHKYDNSTHEIGPSQAWFIHAGDGAPDGMTVDSEGYVWSALWGGSGVIKIDPDAKVVDKIDVSGKTVKWEKDGKKFTSKLEGESQATRMGDIDERPIVFVDLTFNNKFYTDVPIGLTTKDSRSTFLVNRDLLTRFKVNVNPNRKFVLSSLIERSDGDDTQGVNINPYK